VLGFRDSMFRSAMDLTPDTWHLKPET